MVKFFSIFDNMWMYLIQFKNILNFPIWARFHKIRRDVIKVCLGLTMYKFMISAILVKDHDPFYFYIHWAMTRRSHVQIINLNCETFWNLQQFRHKCNKKTHKLMFWKKYWWTLCKLTTLDKKKMQEMHFATDKC